MITRQEENPIVAGAMLAVVAAVAFGVTTPLIKRFGGTVGPFATAALLDAGAAVGSVARRARGEAPTRHEHLQRLITVALLGAVLAPVSLAWGLQHMSAMKASLLLNFETRGS